MFCLNQGKEGVFAPYTYTARGRAHEASTQTNVHGFFCPPEGEQRTKAKTRVRLSSPPAALTTGKLYRDQGKARRVCATYSTQTNA